MNRSRTPIPRPVRRQQRTQPERALPTPLSPWLIGLSLLFLLALLLSAGCTSARAASASFWSGSPVGSGAPAWKGVLKIGTVAPVEGQDAARAAAFLGGVKLAQVEANRRGGIDGRRLELAVLEDGDNPDVARQRARSLTTDPRIIGVAGHFGTDSAAAALQEYRPTGVALVSPATGEDLAGEGFYRLGASDDAIAIIGLAYARTALGASRIAFVVDGDGSAARYGSLRAASLDLQTAGPVPTLMPWTQGLLALAEKIRSEKAQAVLFRGDPEEAAMLLDGLEQPGQLRPALVYLGDGYRLSRLAKAGPGPVYYVSPLGEVASPAVVGFAARFQGRGDMAHWGLAGYRAATAIVAAAGQPAGHRDRDRDGDGAGYRAAVRAGLAAQMDSPSVMPRVYRLEGPSYPGQAQDAKP